MCGELACYLLDGCDASLGFVLFCMKSQRAEEHLLNGRVVLFCCGLWTAHNYGVCVCVFYLSKWMIIAYLCIRRDILLRLPLFCRVSPFQSPLSLFHFFLYFFFGIVFTPFVLVSTSSLADKFSSLPFPVSPPT